MKVMDDTQAVQDELQTDPAEEAQALADQAQQLITDQYWAAKPKHELGPAMRTKIDDYAKYLEQSGIAPELRDSYRNFYGSTEIETTGDQGELQKIHVNNYASLIRSILNFITSQKPAFTGHATNTDTQSQAQTILSSSILDYYLREKRLERSFREATELALFLREGWMSVQWNASLGQVYAINPETKQPIYDGDVEVAVHKLPDVIRDVTKRDSKYFGWLIIREFKNKYDLAAKFPEHAAELVNMKNELEVIGNLRRDAIAYSYDSDEIECYTLFHEKTPAMPQGRIAMLVDADLILLDAPLPYRKTPAFKISTEDLIGTAFGHSQALDLLPLQKAFDTLHSTILSNQNAFGVQNVTVKKGAGVSISQISGGMNLIEVNDHTDIQPLNLTQTPAEVFNYAQMLEKIQETLSGVNATARGNTTAGMSGAAMALLQSTAIQYSSGLQQSFTSLVEDVGTSIIQLLQDYAVTPRIASIVGKHNRPLLKEFKNTDLDQISRVTVDSTNALSKTDSGRLTIADALLQKGLITRPEQYLMLIQTGQLDNMYESETSELLLIRRENEDLADGKSAIAVVTDNHAMHILEHKSVLASPEARQTPQIVQATTAHLQEHLNFLETASPQLLQLMKQQPIAPPQPQGPPANAPQVMNPQTPVQTQAQGVQGPRMPVNPLTKQRFDPQNPGA